MDFTVNNGILVRADGNEALATLFGAVAEQKKPTNERTHYEKI